MTDDRRLTAIRQDLERELASVERQLDDYGSQVGRGGVESADSEGFADSAHVAAERSEAISFMQRLEGAHAEITAALKRFDEGTYGRCERCDREIPIERLEAVPTATMCVACKQSVR
jgi:RNA polymerase-binding protein DksA